jgi:hypothetical protein
MGVAVFNYAVWAARYPELAASVDAALAGAYFAEAGLYLDNTDTSIVDDVPTRLVLLNMVVAHIAALAGATAAGKAGLTGRIASVTEGSVTISTELEVPGTAGWFAQSKYGLAFWQATTRFRTMRYLPGPRPYLGVPGSGGFGRRG